MNEITDGADLGFGTFYGYFDSKEAIAVAVAERLARKLVSELGAVLAAADDPAHALGAVLVTIARRDAEQPAALRFLIEAGTGSGVVEREFAPVLVRLIFDGVVRSRFDSRYALHAPWALASLILGMLFYRQEGVARAEFEQALVYHALRMLGVDEDESVAITHRVTA